MPKKRNEATSKRVASIAGKVLRCLKDCHGAWPIWIPDYEGHGFTEKISVRELRALAASALTQREDVTVYKAGMDLSSTLTQAAELAPGKSIRVGRQIRTQKQFDRALKPKRKPARKGRK